MTTTKTYRILHFTDGFKIVDNENNVLCNLNHGGMTVNNITTENVDITNIVTPKVQFPNVTLTSDNDVGLTDTLILQTNFVSSPMLKFITLPTDDPRFARISLNRVDGRLYLAGNGTDGTDGGVTISNTTAANVFRVEDNTESTSTTTGAIVCSGGEGIHGNLYVGGVIWTQTIRLASSTSGNIDYFQIKPATDQHTEFRISNYNNAKSASITLNKDTGNLDVSLLTGTTFLVNPILNVQNTTASTDPNTGSFIVKGGAGIAGDLNVGGNVNATRTNDFPGRNLELTGGSMASFNTHFRTMSIRNNTGDHVYYNFTPGFEYQESTAMVPYVMFSRATSVTGAITMVITYCFVRATDPATQIFNTFNTTTVTVTPPATAFSPTFQLFPPIACTLAPPVIMHCRLARTVAAYTGDILIHDVGFRLTCDKLR